VPEKNKISPDRRKRSWVALKEKNKNSIIGKIEEFWRKKRALIAHWQTAERQNTQNWQMKKCTGCNLDKERSDKKCGFECKTS
ncbi:32126_t:CDS:1, partial [Gigaspora margarita]